MKLKHLITAFSLALLSWSYGQNAPTIPNVFTPDNDGINDVFQIDAKTYKSVTCSIYNRHGGLVYRYYGTKGFWDGRTHAGIPCVDGVYFVIVELINSSGESEVLQGNVQLVR